MRLEQGIFEQEVREKKNQAYLNKARTGAKGGSRSRKGMNTPFDYMSSKEKKSLNGVVTVMQLATILNWTEWETKDKETQKLLMTKWREIYPNDKIMKELSENRTSKLNSQSYADIVNELGCPKKRRASGPRIAKPKAVAIKSPEMTSQLEFDEPKEEIKQQIQEQVVQAIITKGLHLEYNGTYDVEALNRLFTKLQLLVDGEPSRYNISLSLSEVQED
jgi:hypothetical protein